MLLLIRDKNCCFVMNSDDPGSAEAHFGADTTRKTQVLLDDTSFTSYAACEHGTNQAASFALFDIYPHAYFHQGQPAMNIRILAALAAVALLAACSNNSETGASTGSGASTSATGAPGSEDDLVANVGDRIYYATNASTLSGDARGTLDRQAGWLAKYPQVAVQVAGNCDERGTEEYNLALGQRRANAARDYLVAKGVSSARIATISYGKDKPAALGSDEEAWQKNRNAITSVR
jgi:peptidoglycan-associated lipoprotein